MDRRKLNRCLSALAALTLACGGRSVLSEGDGESTSSSASESSTDTTTDPTQGPETDADDTNDTNDTSNDSDDGDCVSHDDCAPEEVCIDGICQFNCGELGIELQARSRPLMLVLDKSGSMNTQWDHDQDPATPTQSRWTTTHALIDLITNNYGGVIHYGLQLFPGPDATSSCANDPACPACSLGSSPEATIPSTHDTLMAAMPPSDTSDLAGASPAGPALASAMVSIQDGIQAGDHGFAPFVLITDGVPLCSASFADELCSFPGQSSADCKLLEYADPDIIPLIETHLSAGMPTHVVGLEIVDELIDPDSTADGQPDATNARVMLDEMALAGGVPQLDAPTSFHGANNEAELRSALDTIIGGYASCTIDLSAPPNYPPHENQSPFVEFELDGTTLPGPLTITPEACAAGDEEGWIWLVEGLELQLCGAPCVSLMALGELTGYYNCPH